MPKFACKLSVEVVLALLMGLLLLIRNQEKYFKGGCPSWADSRSHK